MFVDEHLNLRLVRLASPDAWSKKGLGLTFLLPHAGSGQCLFRTSRLDFRAGDLLLLNTDSEEARIVPAKSGLAFRSFSLCFEHLFPLFASREIGLLERIVQGLKHLKHYLHTSKVARECHAWLQDVPPQFSLNHRSHLLQVAAVVFSAEFQNAGQLRTGSFRIEERLAAMFERLTMTQIHSMSVDALASQVGCSRRHLNRLFQRHLGVSISTLRMEMRLLKAVSLLRNPDCKVINVAEECGFNHLGLFNTCFKKRFGVTPGQWRDAARTAGRKPEEAPNGRALCPMRTNGRCPWPGLESPSSPETSSLEVLHCTEGKRSGPNPALRMEVSLTTRTHHKSSDTSPAILTAFVSSPTAPQLSRPTP